jgi:glyoxylase I family protein
MVEEELLTLERRLANRDRVEELLGEEFIEIGSGGHVYDKGQLLAAMKDAPPRDCRIEEFDARMLAPDIGLATYCACGSFRSSVWVRRKGEWRIVFHQGTPSDG